LTARKLERRCSPDYTH